MYFSPDPSQCRRRGYVLHRMQMRVNKVLNVTCLFPWFLLFSIYWSETGSKINRKPASICLFDKVCRFRTTIEIITTSRQTMVEMCLMTYFSALLSHYFLIRLLSWPFLLRKWMNCSCCLLPCGVRLPHLSWIVNTVQFKTLF